MAASEIVFVVDDDPDGGFTARAIGDSIFTQADSMEALRDAVRDAVRCHFDDEHFDDEDRPKLIRMHRVLAEVFAA